MALNERLDLGHPDAAASNVPNAQDNRSGAPGFSTTLALPTAQSLSVGASPMVAPAAFNIAPLASADARSAAASGQSFDYQIQYSDPGNLAGTMAGVIQADMNAAVQSFEGHVQGAGTLVVDLNIVPSSSTTAGELADGGPSALMPNGALDGRTLEMPAAFYELSTGSHVPGYSSDIVVDVPSSALGELYFAPNPTAGDSIASVAPSEYDGLTVFRHEIVHGLGFISLRDTTTGTLGSVETEFDHYSSITSSGADNFIGPAAEAAYGGPVPLTTTKNGEQYSHLGNNANDPLAGDLMSGTGLVNGVTHQVSALDFAVLRDIGVPEIGMLACFAAGTRIATPEGDVPVEQLRAGDPVLLAGGGTAPILWAGSRRIDIACHPDPAQVAPVLIAEGAIADLTPARDLYVSPDHALFFNASLIPAKALVNGATIRQVHPSTVTYFHVEIDGHGVILAEGVPAETYLDTGNRQIFSEGAAMTGPDQAETRQMMRERRSCAPLAEAGPAVIALRAQILARAGLATTVDPELSIRAAQVALPASMLATGLIEAVLPEQSGDIVISSRNFVPAEITPDPRDRRRLGVAVSALELHRDGAWRSLALHDPALAEGWHPGEPDHRWTNGRGVIAARLLAGATRLRLRFQAAAQYRQAA